MTTTLEGIAFGEKLHIASWKDPVVDAVGHDPRSDYAERFYLPVLGPSTMWLLRHLALHLDRSPEGTTIETSTTARCLGLGERTGRHAPFLRTVARAIDFNMARLTGVSRLEVRRHLPPLARRHLLRLPESLRAEHARRTGSSVPDDPASQLRGRSRQLALSLLELGESDHEVERQLARWHFHPAIIEESIRWARTARQGLGTAPKAVEAMASSSVTAGSATPGS